MKAALRKQLKILRTQNAHSYALKQNLVSNNLALVLAEHQGGVIAAFKALALEVNILDRLSSDFNLCLPVILGKDEPLVFKIYHHGDEL